MADDEELREFFRKHWKSTQMDFCERMDINRGNFCSWLGGKKSSPASSNAVREWMKQEKKKIAKESAKEERGFYFTPPPSAPFSIKRDIHMPARPLFFDTSAAEEKLAQDRIRERKENEKEREREREKLRIEREREERIAKAVLPKRTREEIVQEVVVAGGSVFKRRVWTEEDRLRVFKRTEGKCYLCKATLQFNVRQAGQPQAWHMEHVLCYSKNPAFDGLHNILPACARENLQKGAHSLAHACDRFGWELYSHIRTDSLAPEVRKVIQDQLDKRHIRIVAETESGHTQEVTVDTETWSTISPYHNETSTSTHCEVDISPIKLSIPEYNYNTQFRIVRTLFVSFISTVYLAKHHTTPVVLKFAKEGHSDNRIVSEINILMANPCPYIATCYGFTRNKGRVGMVMEYLPGGSLQERVEANFNKEDAEFLLRILRQTALAIQFLHSREIAHRDIKPGNILLTHSGNAKVCDLGASKMAEYGTDTHTSVFSGCFKPPQISTRENLSEYNPFKADVYSFGKVLQLITRSGKVGTSLDSLVNSCTQKNEEDRPSFADIVEYLDNL